MEKKANQTALQQAFSELEKLHPNLFNIYSEEGRNFINHFHQFLAVEKQQIIDAYYSQSNSTSVLNGEQYYNETFNK
jgi:hypothetical protein